MTNMTEQMDLFKLAKTKNANPSEVRYKNQLNTAGLDGLKTSMEIDVYYTLISSLRNKNTEKVTFTYKELWDKINKNSKSTNYHVARFKKTLAGLKSKIKQIEFEMTRKDVDTGKTITTQSILFTDYQIDDVNETFTIWTNKRVLDLLKNFDDGSFTEFFLQEVLDRKSIFAKKLLPMLKKWKSVGKHTYSIELLRERLGINPNYSNYDIERRVIKPAVKELESVFAGLTYTKNKKLGSKKIESYTFMFKKQPSIEEIKKDQAAIDTYSKEELIELEPNTREEYVNMILSYSQLLLKSANNKAEHDNLKLLYNNFRKKYDDKFNKKENA